MIETTILILMIFNNFRNNTAVPEDFDEVTSDSYADTEFCDEGELLRETSPDGDYTLLIKRTAAPDFPFGEDHLQVTLFEVIPENETPRIYYRASFKADVANDGAPATYQIEWLEEGVQIALIGSEQPTAYFYCPLKRLNDYILLYIELRVCCFRLFGVQWHIFCKQNFFNY